MLIKKTNNSRSWKCVLGRKGNCKAELKLNILDEFVEEVNIPIYSLKLKLKFRK